MMTKRPDGSRMSSTSHMMCHEIADYRGARADKRWAGARSIHKIKPKPAKKVDFVGPA